MFHITVMNIVSIQINLMNNPSVGAADRLPKGAHFGEVSKEATVLYETFDGARICNLRSLL